MGLPDLLARKERRALRAIQVRLGQQERLVRRDQPVRKVRKVFLVR
jgi:hypothetical protein